MHAARPLLETVDVTKPEIRPIPQQHEFRRTDVNSTRAQVRAPGQTTGNHASKAGETHPPAPPRAPAPAAEVTPAVDAADAPAPEVPTAPAAPAAPATPATPTTAHTRVRVDKSAADS